MAKIQLNTSRSITPMIYAYTTPEIKKHDGWTKIGYTEHNVEKRIQQQANTVDAEYKLEWKGSALFDDGSYETFTDKDFHAYLLKNNIERIPNREWFHLLPGLAQQMFFTFRANHGIADTSQVVIPYNLRAEQAEAVERTAEYYNSNDKKEFLWNAKPRFGKTLAVYDFCKKIKAQNVLIVTNRPAIANSWYSDYVKFLGKESGYLFVSQVSSLADKPGVYSREDYRRALIMGDEYNCIEFVSLEDLKGSKYFGGTFDKLKEIADTNWSLLVVDEAHEGVDTIKTSIAFESIKRDFTLHLSGTPFKALANDKFEERAIYNWTYADEQNAKRNWDDSKGEENPYENLPVLNLFTYQMSEIIRDELEQGIEINGETEEFAFDLNEFFKVNKSGSFIHDSAVERFLDALTTLEKYPFSTPELREEIKHSFWLLNFVDSAKALAKKLENHPVFKDYHVVLAAGDGRLNDNDETVKAFDKVSKAVKEYDKTITLSVGQLATGVTIPEWTAVLMLSNMKSPALYMQAAFRAQNPYKYVKNGVAFRKENAYVFDFDPARTLTIYEQFANDLSSDTVSGRGDMDTRKAHIGELLNFFPVIGEDDAGEMIALNAEKVLSVPRKIHAKEIVRRGFMSNFLFQNINSVFGAPQIVYDIFNELPAVPEPPVSTDISKSTGDNVNVDDEGHADISDEVVIGTATNVFGGGIYDVTDDLTDAFSSGENTSGKNEDKTPEEIFEAAVKKLKDSIGTQVIDPMVDAVTQEYSDVITKAEDKKIRTKIKKELDYKLEVKTKSLQSRKNRVEADRKEALQNRKYSGRTEQEINSEFDAKIQEIEKTSRDEISAVVSDYIKESSENIIKEVLEKKENKVIDDFMSDVRDRLRGFARTIPSFLMAYGNDDVTLANFDTIIPDDVFKEVTGITLESFRFLRDGGDYTDEETGEIKFYPGNHFSPIDFNDGVKEFLRLKKALGNYFDEDAKEDIFDYIPPQKTNQIYTPKNVVKKMVDLLEQENPGCFDNPDKTFIDLYMKSGLYITEIVKRLYKSEEIKRIYPDGKARLEHIFAKQVFGLAPTEIIYRIATSFILGFSDDITITQHNLVMLDALPYAKEGNLETKLDEIFSGGVQTVTTTASKPISQAKPEIPAFDAPAKGTFVYHEEYGDGKVVRLSDDGKKLYVEFAKGHEILPWPKSPDDDSWIID